jgi:hypothetical protein
MDIGSILIGLALLILAGFLVAWPLIDQRPQLGPGPSEADRLRQERDQLLTALRDLDFDYSLGKLQAEDYAPLRADLVSRGAEVLKKLDAATQTPEASPRPAVPDEAIEKAIAAHRQGRAKTGGQAPQAPASDDAIEKAIAARRQGRAKTDGQAPQMPVSDKAIEKAVAERRQARPKAASQACPRCNAAVQPDDRFCPRCGAPLLVRCPQCGTPAQAGDQFCAKCGTKLPDTPAEVSAS